MPPGRGAWSVAARTTSRSRAARTGVASQPVRNGRAQWPIALEDHSPRSPQGKTARPVQARRQRAAKTRRLPDRGKVKWGTKDVDWACPDLAASIAAGPRNRYATAFHLIGWGDHIRRIEYKNVYLTLQHQRIGKRCLNDLCQKFNFVANPQSRSHIRGGKVI